MTTLSIAPVLVDMRIAEVCPLGLRIVLWLNTKLLPPPDWNPSACALLPDDSRGRSQNELVMTTLWPAYAQSRPLWIQTRVATKLSNPSATPSCWPCMLISTSWILVPLTWFWTRLIGRHPPLMTRTFAIVTLLAATMTSPWTS